ncbi:hypothetical protein FRC02_001785 [Tulasnella sp. 418]|nr:hypothetical protein FRC02_001785 [Tulasnella sp. 418]
MVLASRRQSEPYHLSELMTSAIPRPPRPLISEMLGILYAALTARRKSDKCDPGNVAAKSPFSSHTRHGCCRQTRFKRWIFSNIFNLHFRNSVSIISLGKKLYPSI